MKQRASTTQRKPAQNYVVFSQWSRKSYAVFASLGKVVKIARLAIDICVASCYTTATHLLFRNQHPEVDTDDGLPDTPCATENLVQPIATTFAQNKQQKQAAAQAQAAAFAYNIPIIKTRKVHTPPRVRYGLFLCKNKNR